MFGEVSSVESVQGEPEQVGLNTDAFGALDGFDEELMVADLQSQDRMGAIKELVDRLHDGGYVTDSLAFLQSVLDREDLESTVLENGVAFPHARSRSARKLGVAFGISQSGVDFHSEYCVEPVRAICLLAVPTVGESGYLPVLGGLAGLFQQLSFRKGLMACRTPEAMYSFLSDCAPSVQSDVFVHRG